MHTSFRLKLIDWPCSERETSKQQGVLDVARLHPPLFLRSWQPGDAYRPCARHRPRKLKRMLLEARIPKEERPGWPVFESRGEIVWARNLPAAEGYGAGDGTKQALIIEELAAGFESGL
jgi:tRNA(Ile)-lysidine synthase